MDIRRWDLAQGLMGPFMVVDLLEVAKPYNLFRQAVCRRAGGLLLQGQMRAFMATVLLRFAWLDPFVQHANLDQLHR